MQSTLLTPEKVWSTLSAPFGLCRSPAAGYTLDARRGRDVRAPPPSLPARHEDAPVDLLDQS